MYLHGESSSSRLDTHCWISSELSRFCFRPVFFSSAWNPRSWNTKKDSVRFQAEDARTCS